VSRPLAARAKGRGTGSDERLAGSLTSHGSSAARPGSDIIAFRQVARGACRHQELAILKGLENCQTGFDSVAVDGRSFVRHTHQHGPAIAGGGAQCECDWYSCSWPVWPW
jgi:hypothetical protein